MSSDPSASTAQRSSFSDTSKRLKLDFARTIPAGTCRARRRRGGRRAPERIGEGRLEVGVADYADVADAPLLPVLDEVEERVGDVGFGVGPHVEVERPEILAVFRVGAESDDVDAGVRPQQVFVLEARKRLGGRYGAVEQRHEFPVAGIEDLVERDVAAHADLDASQHGEVHVAALRCEGRVELAAEGRAFHEVGRGVLGCGADRYEKRRQ